MKNHYFQMDDRALWSELRSGSLIALEVISLIPQNFDLN